MIGNLKEYLSMGPQQANHNHCEVLVFMLCHCVV